MKTCHCHVGVAQINCGASTGVISRCAVGEYYGTLVWSGGRAGHHKHLNGCLCFHLVRPSCTKYSLWPPHWDAHVVSFSRLEWTNNSMRDKYKQHTYAYWMDTSNIFNDMNMPNPPTILATRTVEEIIRIDNPDNPDSMPSLYKGRQGRLSLNRIGSKCWRLSYPWHPLKSIRTRRLLEKVIRNYEIKVI